MLALDYRLPIRHFSILEICAFCFRFRGNGPESEKQFPVSFDER